MDNVQKQMLKLQNTYLVKNKLITLYIKSTFNNVIINLYENKKMIFCCSCGTKTITGFQRHNLYAVQILLDKLKEKLKSLHIKSLTVYFRGINYKNYYIIKSLFFLKIKRIVNLTSLPHNGCKAKNKKRR